VQVAALARPEHLVEIELDAHLHPQQGVSGWAHDRDS
jgi:hypothetical protein